jgi:hypothetical protein
MDCVHNIGGTQMSCNVRKFEIDSWASEKITKILKQISLNEKCDGLQSYFDYVEGIGTVGTVIRANCLPTKFEWFNNEYKNGLAIRTNEEMHRFLLLFTALDQIIAAKEGCLLNEIPSDIIKNVLKKYAQLDKF